MALSQLRLQKLTVEEGFLDGLDVTFAPGLNVIVGARGVGKTSVLELIRYALRLPHLDPRRTAAARAHAEAVLGMGRVTVSYLDDDRLRAASRSRNDPELGQGSPIPPWLMPEMLGQNELEAIGLDAASRLRLLDIRSDLDPRVSPATVESSRAHVLSLTAQIRGLAAQREVLRQQGLMRTTIGAELEAAKAEEAALLASASAEVAVLRGEIGLRTQQLMRRRQLVEGAQERLGRLTELQHDAGRLAQSMRSERPQQPSPEDLIGVDALGAIVTQQERIVAAIADLLGRATAAIEAEQREIAREDDELRPLRQRFDAWQEGAGAAAQRTSRLEQQLASVDASKSRLSIVEGQLAELRRTRLAAMKAIDAAREQTWLRRQETAAKLNSLFAPKIRVIARHFSDTSEYAAQLSAALKGSGLQHNQLAEWLAERISPQELVDAVEVGDAARLSTVGELTRGRVEKVLANLASSDALGDVLVAPVRDVVDIELLVGRDYRSTQQLSTGQRCSAVLPLLLSDFGRPLLLDQPEDHLDNAYLVDNTVSALQRRTAQTLVVTHNANIPVLGDAEKVIALGSDGRRGYCVEDGPLNDPAIVQLITTLMEGGREAFARRSRFYGS